MTVPWKSSCTKGTVYLLADVVGTIPVDMARSSRGDNRSCGWAGRWGRADRAACPDPRGSGPCWHSMGFFLWKAVDDGHFRLLPREVRVPLLLVRGEEVSAVETVEGLRVVGETNLPAGRLKLLEGWEASFPEPVFEL